MLVLLVFFMFVTPFPVLFLAFAVEPLVIHVGLVPFFHPPSICLIFTSVSAVIVPVYWIVDPELPLFLLMAFMLVLRRPHR